MNFIARLYSKVFNFFDCLLSPFVFLAMRLWMAYIFWNSGQTKIADWDSTVALFADVYKVPFIPPDIAAYLTTATELICPVLLTLGLFTRFATIPMLIMVAVIQFTFLSSQDHFYWAVLLGALLCKGAGVFSLDYFLAKKYCR